VMVPSDMALATFRRLSKVSVLSDHVYNFVLNLIIIILALFFHFCGSLQDSVDGIRRRYIWASHVI